MDLISTVDQTEFHTRWVRARLAALQQIVGEPASAVDPAQNIFEREIKLLRGLTAEQSDAALRAVFDNSRQFALSASRRFSLQFELSDFQDILSKSAIPCTSGLWQGNERSRSVETHQCPFGANSEVRICDWYREAIDGLVTGLGSNERYVRHRSEAHGDDSCLDVYFDDSDSNTKKTLRYGPVPPPMEDALRPVSVKFAGKGMLVKWSGYSAGTIFYTLEKTDASPLCMNLAKTSHRDFFNAVHEIFPDVRLQDAAPLAVYGEGTK